jgi:putative peptidoglycan lipid II flippase
MQNNRYIRIAVILTVTNILGKMLGFCKDILISYHYGISAMTDAVFLAMAVPMIVLGVFTSAADSAIIPQYNRIYLTSGRQEADCNFSLLINILFIIGFIFSLFLLFLPEKIIVLFAPGFNDEQIIYSSRFLKLFSFFGLLHISYCFFSAYLSAYKKVAIRSILSVTTNLMVVIALLIIPDDNMKSVSIAFFIGYFIHGLLPILGAKKTGYIHSWTLNIKSKEFIKFCKIFLPIMGSALLVDINLFIARFLASGLGEGSISVLNYATRLTSIFDSMIIIGLGVIVLPMLSNLNLKGDKESIIRISSNLFKSLVLCLLPIMLIFMYASKEIISVVYFRGNFDYDSVLKVTSIFFILSPQILLISVQTLVIRFFHSFENTKYPLIATTIEMFFSIFFSIILGKLFGLKGISMASTLSVLLSFSILFIMYKRKVGWSKDLHFMFFCKIMFIIIITYPLILIANYLPIHNISIKLIIDISIIISLCLLITHFLFKKEGKLIIEMLSNFTKKRNKNFSYKN